MTTALVPRNRNLVDSGWDLLRSGTAIVARLAITVELYVARFRRWRETGGARSLRVSWRPA